MKIEQKVLVLSFILGLLVWVVDTILDYYFFYTGSFWDLLLLEVPGHELYIRIFTLLWFVIFGLIISRILARQRQAQETLWESKDKAQQYLDLADVILLALDEQGQITMINRKGCEVLGYQEEELLGRDWFDTCLPASSQEQVKDVFRQLMIGHVESVEMVEGLVVTKSGRERIIQWHNTVLEDKSGSIIGSLSSGEDITERRSLEEQLYQAQKMEAVGRLAGGVAHDFNNLLTAINGFAELMRYELPSEDPLQELLAKVLQSGQRATNLVRQLLAFSRRQVIEPRILSLNTIVTDIEKMLKRIIGEDVLLKTHLAQDLWPVKMDPTQIEQVIVNLAVNARDAMPDGGRLTIETANVILDETYAADHLEAKPGEHVLLAVSDNGVGMSETVKSHIFEPFFTTKDQEKGTGLGLATVYGIVKQNGGNIWLYSEEGHGTTFKLYFPRAVTGPTTASSGPQSAEEWLEGTETILLVEDDPAVRELVVYSLRERGYTVLEAANGEEGLRLSKEHCDQKIDLLLTDVILPGFSGRALADELIQGRPDLKVLYMSGYTENIIAHHGVVDLEIAFMQKPFRPMALVRKVRSLLDDFSVLSSPT